MSGNRSALGWLKVGLVGKLLLVAVVARADQVPFQANGEATPLPAPESSRVALDPALPVYVPCAQLPAMHLQGVLPPIMPALVQHWIEGFVDTIRRSK